MANQVGAFLRRGVAGPLTAGPDSGDTIFMAIVANRGPVDVPTLITSYGRFLSVFGGATVFTDGTRYSAGSELAKLFFEKGVNRLMVTRIVGTGATLGSVDIDGAVATPTLTAIAKGEGSWSENYEVVISEGTRADTFKLEVFQAGGEAAGDDSLEKFDNLEMNDEDLEKVSNSSDYITLESTDDELPTNGTYALSAGVDDNEPEAVDIVGTDVSGAKTGLKVFRRRMYGRGFILAPDLDHDTTVRDELRVQSEKYFRVYLASGPEGLTPTTVVADAADARAFNIGYHYPRVVVTDRRTKERKTVPASAHVIADWIKAMRTKGPAKPPAGDDFRLDFIQGIETRPNGQPLIDEGVAEVLVANGVNPIWDRDGTGPRVWGGRSTSTDAAWIYLHDAYLWCLISSQVQAMLDAETYESDNNGLLFRRMNGGMRLLMLDLHGQGAFHGPAPLEGEEPKPEHAFSTRCDADMLTPNDKNNGIFRAEIWFKSALTAETIIITVAKRVNE